jgi:penicillin-binding protein 1A
VTPIAALAAGAALSDRRSLATELAGTTGAILEVTGGRTLLARRGRIWLRRAVTTVVVLSAACVVAGTVLLELTPSVGNARSLASAQAARHHSPFPGPPVPARFATAPIATEDHRFASEPGVDPIAIARVLLAGVTRSGDQGGATLYQQLAKLLYTPGRSGPAVEAEQLALAIKLKLSYTGAQILRMYADVAYFGNGFYGLPTASCGYFGRPTSLLSWPQAALLAGLVQAPSAYDPLVYPRLARSREQHVIARLVVVGALDATQSAAALAIPLRRLVAGAGRRCQA